MQNKDIGYEWTEIMALIGVASILTAIISLFVTI